MNSVQRIFKNIISLGLSFILPRISTFILVIYIARYLGDQSFGKYSTAIYFTILVALLADLGVSKLTVRELAKNIQSADELFHILLILKIFLVTAAYLIIVLGCHLLSYSAEVCELIYIFGAAACTFSISKLFNSAFQAFEKMEYETIGTTVHAILKFGLGLTVLILNLGLRVLAITFLVARLLELLLVASLFYMKISKFNISSFKFDFRLIKEMFLKAIPFSAVIILAEIYFKIDMVMLSKMRPMEEVGWYSSAYNLIVAFVLIPGIVMGSLFPLLSRSSETSIEKIKIIYERSFKYLLYLSLFILIAVFFLAEGIITLFYGKEYIPAVIALKILVFALPLIFTDTAICQTLTSLNIMKIQIIYMGLGVIINIVLNLIFIQRWGYIGASVTTLISAIINFTLWLKYMSGRVHRIKIINYLPQIAISSILLIAIFLFFDFFNLNKTFALLIGLFSYIFMLLYISAFDQLDYEIFKKLLPKRV